MRKQKDASARSVRRETDRTHVFGERHNVDAGSGVKTVRGKIPKMPSEKIDVDGE